MDRLFRRADAPLGNRIVRLGAQPGGNAEFQYAGNRIKSTKYTWATFLPRGLYEQFRRVANLYFLFHAAISLTPVTPVSPVTTITPLVFVVGLAMLKELLEDVRRGRSDFAINNRMVEVLGSDGSVRMTAWKDVEVGDIVCVECDAEFPADLLCLATTGAGGNAYVETMNLDGETTLK
eukprot:SM003836S14561  [mRNA]  locus=s3836:54:1185:- [translate_table: standard]